MYITKLQTFGYRASDLDMTLGPLTGVFGENEAGKSQVIDAIRLLIEGAPPDGTLVKQVATVSGIMRYARDPREGIRIVGEFDTGQSIVRSWVANGRGEVTQTITQDLADVAGLKGQEALLAGLVPEAALWDVRALVNQSGEKGRNALLSLFASRGQATAMAVCPSDAPDWALPTDPKEPAAIWVMRALARCRERLKVATGEVKEATARLRSLEDAWAGGGGPTMDDIRAQSERVGQAQDHVARMEALAALRANLAKGAPPEVDPKAVDAAFEDEKAAVLAEEAARGELERCRDARLDLHARVKEANTYLKSRKTIPATKGCEKCGHGAKPAVTSDLDPAKKREAEACVANAEVENAALVDAATLADVALRDALKRRFDARQRGLELDKQASQREAYDAMGLELQLAEAELEDAEQYDLAAEVAKSEDLQHAWNKAEEGRARKAMRDEAKSDLHDAEESVRKYEKLEEKFIAVQSAVLDDLRSAIEKPVTAMVGRPVQVRLEDMKGNADLRWIVGGVDVAGLSDATALSFLIGMRLALAPLSNARFKLMTADRFEAVSKERRVPFLSRLKQALDAGVIHQAIVCGCPDTIPNVEGMKAVML